MNRSDRDAVAARILAIDRGGFFLTVIDAEDARPLRPGIIRRAVLRGLGQDFQLQHAAASVAQGGAHAVGAGIAAADDDDILALGADVTAVGLCLESSRLWVLAVRKSIAKWTPFRLRPSTGRSRGLVAPPQSTAASKSSEQLAGRQSPCPLRSW